LEINFSLQKAFDMSTVDGLYVTLAAAGSSLPLLVVGGLAAAAGAPVVATGALVAGIGALGYAGYQSLTASRSDGLSAIQEKSIASGKLSDYVCAIQAHHASLYPDRPIPHTISEVAEALRNPTLFKEVYKAAQAEKQGEFVTALQDFGKNEAERLRAIAESTSAPAPNDGSNKLPASSPGMGQNSLGN
jgi:hypothetical protein